MKQKEVKEEEMKKKDVEKEEAVVAGEWRINERLKEAGHND